MSIYLWGALINAILANTPYAPFGRLLNGSVALLCLYWHLQDSYEAKP